MDIGTLIYTIATGCVLVALLYMLLEDRIYGFLYKLKRNTYLKCWYKQQMSSDSRMISCYGSRWATWKNCIECPYLYEGHFKKGE